MPENDAHSFSRGEARLLVRSLRYHLIRGRHVSERSGGVELYDRAYDFWRDFWSRVLEKNGSDHRPHPDDFFRQDYIGVFEHVKKPIALHAHTIFDLRQRSTLEHSYFSRYYTKKSVQVLLENRAPRVMTLEFYSVDPAWRTAERGVSLASTMVGLSLRIAQLVGVDAVIAIARRDIGIDRMAHHRGAVTLDSNLIVHNTPCAIVAFFRDAIYRAYDLKAQSLVEYYWRRRDGISPSDQTGSLREAA